VRPATVFDIGVGEGTPWLYGAFPRAKLVLVEPQQAFRPHLERLCERLGADLHPIAVGAEGSSGNLFIPDLGATSASLRPWTDSTRELTMRRGNTSHGRSELVTVRTLDAINVYPPPYMLKIDVEGSELDVLKGASRTLAETQLIVTEASILARFDHDAKLHDIAQFLLDHDLVLFDLVELHQEALGGRLRYVDAAFLRRDLAGA
jgi:FkbM family methyltransferase